jgi:hypothetical protein
VRRRLAVVALAAVGLLLGGVGVAALREATMSTHHSVDPASEVRVELSGRTRGAERGQSLAEMVEAQLLTCRLEVKSDLVRPVRAVGEDRFVATLRPAMDETNRRQFRGCVEDFSVDHVQIDVVGIADGRTRMAAP